jgi:aconitate hydratase
MLNLSNRIANGLLSLQRIAVGMATVTSRIGDSKVPMSLLEEGAYIEYQRIEDSLAVVRSRHAFTLSANPIDLTLRLD